jgi:hypothetical protein
MILAAGTGDLTGAIDGQNRTFVAQVTLTANVVVYVNGLARLGAQLINNGYTLSGQTLTLSEAPVPGDTVWLYQPDSGSTVAVTNVLGPVPAAGKTTAFHPFLSNDIHLPEGSVNAPLRPRLSAGR